MKIRLIEREGRRPSWQADLGAINGKRYQRSFPTKEKAEEYLRVTAAQLKREGESGVGLASADRVLFESWRDRLASVGATIQMAGEFYLQHHPGTKPAVPLPELGEAYIDELVRLKRSQRYVRHARGNMRRMLETLGDITAPEITRDMIDRYVRGKPSDAAYTQMNRKVTASGFLGWLQAERHISINPLEGRSNRLRMPQLRPDDILSYSAEDVRRLLDVAVNGGYAAFNRSTREFYTAPYHDCLGYITAALFCGVRPEEIAQSELGRLNLKEKTLLVSSRAAKTNKPRVIELEPVAVEWFELWKELCPNAGGLVPKNFDRKWRALKKEAGLPTLHDGLRHTFATMHYAAHQNAGQLKALMGHSQTEDTLFQHYRAVVTVSGETVNKRMSIRFWGLTPKKVK
jgi:integrase